MIYCFASVIWPHSWYQSLVHVETLIFIPTMIAFKLSLFGVTQNMSRHSWSRAHDSLCCPRLSYILTLSVLSHLTLHSISVINSPSLNSPFLAIFVAFKSSQFVVILIALSHDNVTLWCHSYWHSALDQISLTLLYIQISRVCAPFEAHLPYISHSYAQH